MSIKTLLLLLLAPFWIVSWIALEGMAKVKRKGESERLKRIERIERIERIFFAVGFIAALTIVVIILA